MITIITGGVNRGKTTGLLSVYREIGGDGFYSAKVFENGDLKGYDITRLSDGKAIPFVYKDAFIPEGKVIFRRGPFCFMKDGLLFAEQVIEESICGGVNPIFIDEIGPVELEKKGFYQLLTGVLDARRDLYLVIRRNCLIPATKLFQIKEYRIIDCEEQRFL